MDDINSFAIRYVLTDKLNGNIVGYANTRCPVFDSSMLKLVPSPCIATEKHVPHEGGDANFNVLEHDLELSQDSSVNETCDEEEQNTSFPTHADENTLHTCNASVQHADNMKQVIELDLSKQSIPNVKSVPLTNVPSHVSASSFNDSHSSCLLKPPRKVVKSQAYQGSVKKKLGKLENLRGPEEIVVIDSDEDEVQVLDVREDSVVSEDKVQLLNVKKNRGSEAVPSERKHGDKRMITLIY